jgi:hypothetical protein
VTRLILLAMLLTEIALVVLFIFSFKRWMIDWRLNGMRVPANVTVADPDFNFVAYGYQVAGTSYTGDCYVGDGDLAKLGFGALIEVVVSPYDASIAGLPDQVGCDFLLPAIPGTPFHAGVIALVLPGLIALNAVGIMVLLLKTIGKERQHDAA